MNKLRRSDYDLPILEQAIRCIERGDSMDDVELKFGYAVMKEAKKWLE